MHNMVNKPKTDTISVAHTLHYYIGWILIVFTRSRRFECTERLSILWIPYAKTTRVYTLHLQVTQDQTPTSYVLTMYILIINTCTHCARFLNVNFRVKGLRVGFGCTCTLDQIKKECSGLFPSSKAEIMWDFQGSWPIGC